MSKVLSVSRGFTLVEMAVVFVIVGLLITLPLDFFRVWMDARKQKITEEHIAQIKEAIAVFVKENGALPCPASLVAAYNDPQFGQEQVGSGVSHCDTGDVLTGVTLVSGRDPDGAGPLSNRVRIGAVPTRTLDVDDSIMLDGWGNRIVYAVTANLTQVFRVTGGGIYVEDGAAGTPNNVTNEPGVILYVLLSAGPDGVGAYNREGKKTFDCKNPNPPGSARDNENCDFTLAPGQRDAVFRSTVYSRATGNQHFDDYIDYVAFIPGFGSEICGPKQAFYSPGHPAADADGCVKTILIPRWIEETMPCGTGGPPSSPSPIGDNSVTSEIDAPLAAGGGNCSSISNATRRYFVPNDARIATSAAFTAPKFGASGVSVYTKTGLVAKTTGKVGVRAVVPVNCSGGSFDEPLLLGIFVKNEMIAASILYDVGDGSVYAGGTGVATGETAVNSGDSYDVSVEVFSFSNRVTSNYNCDLANQQNIPFGDWSPSTPYPCNGSWGTKPRVLRCWAGTMNFGDGLVPGHISIYERTDPYPTP